MTFLRQIIIAAAVSLAAFTAALPAAKLSELIRAVASQPRKGERERPGAFVSQSGLEGVVVELHPAAIPCVADVAPRVHQPPVRHLRIGDESVSEVVAYARASIQA